MAKKNAEYQLFLILGIVFFAIGAATDTSALWVLGIALLIVFFMRNKNWGK